MDLKLDPGLPNHYKTYTLAKLLKIPIVQAVGHVTCLKCAVMRDKKRKVDGILVGWNEQYISKVAFWESDPDVFVESLLRCGGKDMKGFLEQTSDGTYLIHEWVAHQGEFLLHRAEYNRKYQEEQRSSPTAVNITDTASPRSELVKLFHFCKSPGLAAKSASLEDLVRQGVPPEKIMAYANDPMKRVWGFYDFVNALRPKPEGAPDNGRHSTVKELEAWAKKDPKNAQS